MARQIKNSKLIIQCNVSGAPQSATIEYEVWDGNASKSALHTVSEPDWNKTLHSVGASGEFWRDEMDKIKLAEGVS